MNLPFGPLHSSSELSLSFKHEMFTGTSGIPLTSLEPADAGGISVPHLERWETKPKADSGTIPRTDLIPISKNSSFSTGHLWPLGRLPGTAEVELSDDSTKVWSESVGSKGVGSLSSKSVPSLGFQDGVGCWEGEKPPPHLNHSPQSELQESHLEPLLVPG